MLRIWDTKLKRELEPIALPQSASCVRVSPDGHYAATASADGDDAAIQLWQLAKTVAPPRLLPKWPYKDDEAGLVETAEALDAPIRKLAIGDEGARLFVATSDGKLRLIDTKELKQVGEFEFARSDVPASFALLSESSVIAGQRGQAPREWDATKGQMQRDFSMPSNQKPGGARWQLSADGKLLMTFAEDSQVNLWDVPKGEWLRSLSPHSPERAVEAALSPDGRLLLAADDLGLLRLIDTASGQPIRDFSDKAGETVSRLVFSLDGKKAAGGGAKGKIWIWDVATGKIVQTSSKFDGIVKDLAFTADGKRLIAVSEAPDVLVWDVVAGEERRSFPLRQGAVCVTLAPDGKYAVTASPDNAVQIWRLP